MKYPININRLGKKLEFIDEVLQQKEYASNYLNKFRWCERIIDCNLYLNFGKILCIFLFEIENASSPEDNFIWVVVGDVPSMYMDVYGPKSTREVLEVYVNLSRDWIDAIEKGEGIEKCFPFDNDPSLELAGMLKSRVDRIEFSIIPDIEDISLPEPLFSL
ncbi:hypothetical protein ACUN24_25075 [Pedobacter sp. WC2501]|uniref:hypothetical protein n=1 Tax=Pedobacter sp. WC2501 TaxID=3461400 RepID=UPI0040451BF6